MIAEAGALALGMGLAIAYGLLTDELRAWLPYLARRVVRSAAAQLPPPDREPYERDWLAELAAVEDRPLWSLLQAVHLRLGARGVRESLLGISLRDEPLRRAIDISLGTLLALLFAPVLLARAAVVALVTKKVPLVFVEEGGRDGEPFRLLRFRPAHRALRPSRRRSGAGSMWIELLPHLFNVVKGDLSLVGPAALPPLREKIPDALRARWSVRPGLVDPVLMPVAHERPADLDEAVDFFERYVASGAEYVRSRSLREDLGHLVRAPVLFSRL